MYRSQRNCQRHPPTSLTMQRKKSINKVTSNAATTNRKSAAHVGTANTMLSADGKEKVLKNTNT